MLRGHEERRSLGFTLIELLVVVAIMSILMALILPALKGAKEKTMTVVCAGNLKQIGLASASYAQDHNGWGQTMNFWPGANDLVYAWTKSGTRLSYGTGDTAITYPIAALLVEPNYLTAKVMECPSAQGSDAVKHQNASNNYFVCDATRYKKTPADGFTVVYGTYLVRQTALKRELAFASAWADMNGHPERWGCRFGQNPSDALAADFVYGNLFAHTTGINTLFEDGAVIWLTGIPSTAQSYFAAYTLLNGDSRMKFMRFISRGDTWNQ